MKKLTTYAVLAIMLAACSSPLDKPYSQDTFEEDAKAIKEAGALDDEDAKLLAGWIMKSALSGESLDGKTYNEIITEAKDFKAEQEALAEKARAEAEERKNRMKNAAVISIYEKGFTKLDYEDYNWFEYIIKNKSDKDIKAFKFSFDVYNTLGDKIGNGYQVSETKNQVAGNGEFSTKIYYDYNQFKNDDNIIKNAGIDELTFDIELIKVVYTDGTVLE